MKHFLLSLFAVLLFAGIGQAQVTQPQVVNVTSDITGASTCGAGVLYYQETTGKNWERINGICARTDGISGVPSTRTVNGHALSANVTVTPSDLSLVIGTNTQAWDADLDAIAALTPSNDDVIQRKAGVWSNRTMAQVKTDLSLVKGDVGLGNVVNLDTSTAANITDSTNKRFVTDAQRTVIQNTSGTNTGDQDLSGLVPTSRTVNGHPLSANVTVTPADLSLGNVTNDAQTKAAVVPNTAPAAGQIAIGNAGGTAYVPLSFSQDCTVASTGVVTCLKTNNVSFGTAATQNTGTSGATIPFLNGANTVSGVETHTKAVIVSNSSLTDNGSTIATDASLSNNFRVTALTANVTLSNPTNAVDGQVVTWEVIQNASAAKTLAFGANFAFGAEITACTISTALSSHSFLTAIYNSTTAKWYVRGCLTGY